MQWTNDGLFLLLTDARGNVSMINRLGEFVWISKNDTTSSKFLLNTIVEKNEVCIS